MIRDNGDLGPQLYSFAVISDTHVNAQEDQCNSPFPVNAQSNPRFRHVVADLNQRDIEFVVHLGDLVHPVPETGLLYQEAAAIYRDIEAKLNVPVYHVPGNHDIGDTPIKGAPASPTTEAMIKAWRTEFGDQWQAFTHGEIRFILLNAQLINSGLPDEADQAQWLEAELAAASDRVMLMLHHPLYLCFPEEPPHYDNADPPGRDWLLGLLEKYAVEAIFAGHAHNFWFNRIGKTDYYLAPSTSFVRQDYSEMYRTTPDESSEYGRADLAKLGYFIVRVYEKGHAVQFVRTFGAELGVDEPSSKAQLIGPTPRENAAPKIGFDLRRNWAEIAEVPPSGGLDEFDRKIVRNDYQLLALTEMGVRNIRIPLADLRDPVRRKRLETLTHLGFRPTIFGFGVPGDADLALIEGAKDHLLDWEMTVDWPLSKESAAEIAHAHARTGLSIYLSRMRSKDDLAAGSTYYHVINHGFAPEDGQMLDVVAGLKQSGVIGAVFRLGGQLSTSQTLDAIEQAAGQRGIAASVHLRIAGENPAAMGLSQDETLKRVQAAMTASHTLQATRIFCDAFVENDRGYFPRIGAIDLAGNPTALWKAVKLAHLQE